MDREELTQMGINADLYYLMELIEEDKHEEVISIINNNPSIMKERYSEDDPGTECLLIKAINSSAPKCAKILIEHGANVDHVIDGIFHNRNSMLHFALKLGEFDIARLLLANVATVWKGDYSIEFSCYRHDAKFVENGFLSKEGYKEMINKFESGINPTRASKR